MNFATCESNIDQNQLMKATVERVDGITFTQNQKPLNVCLLRDENNASCSVKIFQGNSPAMSPQQVGQTLDFSIKAYRARNGNVYYSGFWQCPNPQQNPTYAPQQAPPPQNNQQAPQQAPPPQQSPPPRQQQPQNRNGDKKEACICRQAVLKSTLENWVWSDQARDTAEEVARILTIVRPLSKWAFTGQVPQEPAPDPVTPEQAAAGAEDPPF